MVLYNILDVQMFGDTTVIQNILNTSFACRIKIILLRQFQREGQKDNFIRHPQELRMFSNFKFLIDLNSSCKSLNFLNLHLLINCICFCKPTRYQFLITGIHFIYNSMTMRLLLIYHPICFQNYQDCSPICNHYTYLVNFEFKGQISNEREILWSACKNSETLF